MRDREQRFADLHLLGASRSTTVQPQLRWTSVPDHLDVLPQHPAGMPGAERLHARFLRGEAAGKMRGRITSPRTIGNLPFGEDPLQKALAVTLQHVRDAGDVGRVEAQPDDVHA